jgi:imidazolonepropionase
LPPRDLRATFAPRSLPGAVARPPRTAICPPTLGGFLNAPDPAVLFTGASAIATCVGPAAADGEDPSGTVRGAALLVRDGRVAAVGPEPDLARTAPDAARVDCSGMLLAPGFVDAHTHAVFGRWRADEYALRSAGVPYMEIARRGGGINASVADLRARSEDELVELTLPRLAEMLHSGTTTAEVKSGYGLRTEDELKMLRAIRRLDELQPITLVPTFLGAHEVPPEFHGRRAAYVDLLIEEMIPAVAAERLARWADVFMEPGVFDRADAERILRAALEVGLGVRLHADELEWSGGAELAVELGAASADHLGAVSQRGIELLGTSDTVATLLPVTLLFLGRRSYAPARALLDAGATIAIATDFNPGSAPNPGMPLALTVACSQGGMRPTEALRAATAGGAAALRLADGAGTLAVGAPADVTLWNVPDVDHLPYRVGGSILAGVWKSGLRVH